MPALKRGLVTRDLVFDVTVFIVGLHFFITLNSLGVMIYAQCMDKVYQRSLRVIQVTGCKLNSPIRE